jgi:hypothetical protein
MLFISTKCITVVEGTGDGASSVPTGIEIEENGSHPMEGAKRIKEVKNAENRD